MSAAEQSVTNDALCKTPVALVRENRKLRKSDVSKAVGCDKGHYWNIEAGKQRPSPELARKIARFFGNAVTEHQLLYPEDYMHADTPLLEA